MVKKNILGTIGTTPMVRINRLCPNPNVKIFAKLEGFNPTGSIKDRIALRMIEAAERDGRLTPGKTIIEPTSGNTGIGLAIVGIVKGYPVEIVMSEAVSIERRKIIRSYGAKVILTPAEEGTDGAIRLARKKVADAPGRYFMPDQFANASNYLAHYQSTALEIWQQTGGNIDYLVCAIGTSDPAVQRSDHVFSGSRRRFCVGAVPGGLCARYSVGRLLYCRGGGGSGEKGIQGSRREI